MPEFCPDCEVSMDLHEDPDDCHGASRKAEALSDMTNMMFAPFLRG